MLERIFELVKEYEKPAYLAKAGDIVLLSVSGHCGASSVNGVWVIDQRCEEEIRELVKEYHNRENKNDYCEHCGMSASLQYRRFIVRTITHSDLEQCQDLDIRVDELYERLYTI